MGDWSLTEDRRLAAWVEGGGGHGARVEIGCCAGGGDAAHVVVVTVVSYR